MPFQTVERVLKKLTIAHNIRVPDNTPVYYMWSSQKPKLDKKTGLPSKSFFLVDYDEKISEWYLTYVTTEMNIFRGTVDDVTGDISISN